MRISSRDDDPGYGNFLAARANGKVAVVHLDGIEVKECITADDERGCVMRPKLDANGKPQIDPHYGDRLWVEWVCGEVEIECVCSIQ